MIQPKQYARKVTYVEAIQVTPANISEVAGWCKGVIEGSPDGNPAEYFIRVKVFRAANDRQTQAFVGDWVLKTMPNKDSFKVWTNPAFFQHFTDASLDENVEVEGFSPFTPSEVTTPIHNQLSLEYAPKPAPRFQADGFIPAGAVRVEMGEHTFNVLVDSNLPEDEMIAVTEQPATTVPNNI